LQQIEQPRPGLQVQYPIVYPIVPARVQPCRSVKSAPRPSSIL